MERVKLTRTVVGALLSGLAAALAAVLFLSGVSQLRQGQEAEGRRRLETAVRRAAVACYAAEGVYPPDLAYLQSRYGLQVDTARYAVSYQAFASNLMPEITVLELPS